MFELQTIQMSTVVAIKIVSLLREREFLMKALEG